jgi:hypothetical protein
MPYKINEMREAGPTYCKTCYTLILTCADCGREFCKCDEFEDSMDDESSFAWFEWPAGHKQTGQQN